jgi:dTDP-4-dehydrorhamnose 3,5-epimerase
MLVTKTKLPGVLILEPCIFGDDRGFFFESYNQREFEAATGITCTFVQDNHSKSTKGVLRGLHYQIEQAQGKLVRVLEGAIFDVAVDVRLGSPTFGKYIGVELSADNNKQLWIPPDFAHGFLVLSEVAQVHYKATDYYAPEHERAILWNDLDIDIDWPYSPSAPLLSEKDRDAYSLSSADLPRYCA